MHLSFRFPINIQTGSINSDHIFNILKKRGSLPIFISSKEENGSRADFHFLKKKIHTKKFISYFSLSNNLDFSLLNNITRYIHLTSCNIIVAFGGFYSLNIAKIIALAVNYKCSIDDLYIDKVNLKNQNINKSIDIFYIPTSVKFGLEYNSSFFLYNKDFGYKLSSYSYEKLINTIYIDPKIYSSKLEFFQISLLSLIGFNIDCILSKNTNPLTINITLKSLDITIQCIENILNGNYEINNLKADLILANHFLGISYFNTQAGIFYSLASSIFFSTDLKIQESISVVFPHLLDYLLNYDSDIYNTILKTFKKESISDLMSFIKDVYKKFEIPTQLKSYGVDKNIIPVISDIAYESPYFKLSKKELSKKELDAILLMCY